MKKVPFPQANNLGLILNILCEIENSGISKFMVNKKFHLNEREGSYYLDALYYLNLVEKINVKYFINENGMKVKNAVSSGSKNEFIIAILRDEFINDLYNNSKLFKEKKDKQGYISSRIMKEKGLGINTAERRASTIISWFNWIDINNDW